MSYADAHPRKHIVIVDDHPLVRRVLRQILSLEPGLEVVGDVASGEELLELLTHSGDTRFDLFLIDFSLPGMNGAELVRTLLTADPDVRCLVVSSHHEPVYVSAALTAGARGYVAKGDPDALVSAIDRVLEGETVVEP